MLQVRETRHAVAAAVAAAPVVGVVRTATWDEAATQARSLIAAGLRLVEVTFTIPGAPSLVEELLAERPPGAAHHVGMGTVTTVERAERALAAGAEFLISPNVSAAVAGVARASGTFLVLGALTPTEVLAARELGADLVKVYPLAPVGGAAYLSILRQPLPDVPLLAAGGLAVEDIAACRRAGASAFGIGAALLLGAAEAGTGTGVARALALARGEGDAA